MPLSPLLRRRHPMGTILTGLCALSTCHPEQNPAYVVIRRRRRRCRRLAGGAGLAAAQPVAHPCQAAPLLYHLVAAAPSDPFHHVGDRCSSPPHPHPLKGQHVYTSREVQDKQIVRLIGERPAHWR